MKNLTVDPCNPQTWPVREVVEYTYLNGLYREKLGCGHRGASMMGKPDLHRLRRCKECALRAIREKAKSKKGVT